MGLVVEFVSAFVLTAMVYLLIHAFLGIPLYKEIILTAVFLGFLLGGVRLKHGGEPNSIDKFGMAVATIFLIGSTGYLIYDIDRSSPMEGNSIEVFTIFFLFVFFCCLPGFAIYGFFGFLSMIMPAPSGRRRRPGPVERPYSYPERGRSGYGDDVDPGVYGGRRDPPRPQEPPHIHIHMPPGGGQGGQPGTSKGPEPAPPDASRVDYQPAQGYSTDYAQQLFRESRVRGAPSNTKAARTLAGYCLAALGPHAGMAFLNAAARDDKLPKKTRQFYAHALNAMNQT